MTTPFTAGAHVCLAWPICKTGLEAIAYSQALKISLPTSAKSEPNSAGSGETEAAEPVSPGKTEP